MTRVRTTLIGCLAIAAATTVACPDTHGDPILAPSGQPEAGEAGNATVDGAVGLDAPPSDDAAELDADAALPATRWCLRPTQQPTICEDFDIPGERVSLFVQGGGTAEIDTSAAVSQPASLLTQTPANPGGAIAFFGTNTPTYANVRALHLQYDLLLVDLTADVITHQLRFNRPGVATSYLLELFLQPGGGYGAQGPENAGDAGSFLQLLASPKRGTWSHVADDVLASPPSRTLTVDGKVALQTSLDAASLVGSINIQVGIDYVTAGTSCVLRIDNLLLNVE